MRCTKHGYCSLSSQSRTSCPVSLRLALSKTGDAKISEAGRSVIHRLSASLGRCIQPYEVVAIEVNSRPSLVRFVEPSFHMKSSYLSMAKGPTCHESKPTSHERT